MKIMMLQLGPKVGDLDYNFALIERCYKQALDAGVDICLFPELITTGYYCEDLFHKPSFIEELSNRLAKLIPKIGQVAALISTPILDNGELYSQVLAIQNGKIIGKTYKHELPNYGIFDEKRYFKAGNPQIININGHKIGAPICEDIWFEEVCAILKSQGAEVLLVPNASPYDKNKFAQRVKIVSKRFAKTQLPIVYCNQVLAQDGIIFDGTSFAYDGNISHLQPSYLESTSIIEIENRKILKPSQNVIYSDRPFQKQNMSEEFLGKIQQKTGTYLDVHKDFEVNFDTKITAQMKFPERFNEDKIYGAMVFGLREYLHNNAITKAILGLSGGIDSALVAAIAADAIGPVNVRGIMLPSEFTSDESLSDARETAKLLGISYEEISITEMVLAATKTMNDSSIMLSPIARENLQARIRGVILMAGANSTGAALLTTGNKSEMATGYATLYGDMCGAFNPIKDLYKTELFKIAKYRNSSLPLSIEIKNNQFPIMPDNILTKAPTAELRANQKDSDSLPEYPLLDQILELYIEQDLSINQISALGFERKIVEKIARLIKMSEFKRRQSAPGVKLSTRTLEKDRRYPITNGYS